ncbi:MAG: N-acetylglucosamine-6-phosphate deacetylase [Acidobacteriota bacterium]|nr:N-acetylglucosamine-6-phosphate deacetylase [Acidobacteriota bacterium]MDQ3418674.1 N-acetylglucosamine-6-phosphate deacetylase [Acidobacteriota bacterium]
MIHLTGATVVLPDRLLTPGRVSIHHGHITEVQACRPGEGRELEGHFIVPGFIDVHVHGIEGTDALDGADAIARIAARLPPFGVTAFCPTSIACTPVSLREMLAGVRVARETRRAGAARVLPAHLESNFISSDFKGAQPEGCIRAPRELRPGDFSGADILDEIAAARGDVGIVTVAPEIDGVLDLIADLAHHGHRVSLGHSGATYAQAREGIAAGARHATHLFNRMSPFGHREPGLVGAILESDLVAAEIICDGVHVHPGAVRAAVAAKGASKIMAVTDGTAGSGIPRGQTARLGGRRITISDAAYLDDGTLAGSVLTMDRAFAMLVKTMGFSVVDAAQMCSTTPARELGLDGFGAIVPGAVADLVVLDAQLQVVETYIAGAPSMGV